MKEIIAFFTICFYFLGAVGGTILTLYQGNKWTLDEWYITLGVIVLAVLAFPKFKEALYLLIGKIKVKSENK